MSTLSTVVGLSDFLPIMVLAGSLLAFMALVLFGMGSENRSAYFRRWAAAILATAGFTAASGLWIQKLHARSLHLQKLTVARHQIQAIRLAATEHLIESGNWPAGENREIFAKLLNGGEKERELLGKCKLKFAPDGSVLDPWGRPYHCVVDPESGLTVQSCGPNGIKDTEDDLR